MHSSRRFWCATVAAAACLFFAVGQALAAYEAYLTVKGSKQGQFAGEGSQATRANKQIPVLKFSMGVESPRRASSGQAAGKSPLLPITIVKDMGAASPQLQRALATNEILQEVVVELVRMDSQGKEEIYRTLRFTDGRVTAISMRQESGGREIEEVTIVFPRQNMEVKNQNNRQIKFK